MKPHYICLSLICMMATQLVGGPLDFGGYYTEVKAGQAWEAYSRTGKDADVVVQLTKAGGQLVFWRGASYLPFWKTANDQWSLEEIIPRSGDGIQPMPDRVNAYSHVELIENTPAVVMVHWRYLASFGAGNPHANVSPNHFVDEWFSITPTGRIERVIKNGTARADDWNDPSNQIWQVLQLTADGVVEISRQAAQLSHTPAKVVGNPIKGPGLVVPSLRFKFDEGLGEETKEDTISIRMAWPARSCAAIPRNPKPGTSGTSRSWCWAKANTRKAWSARRR